MYAQSHAGLWTQEYDREESYTRRLTHYYYYYNLCILTKTPIIFPLSAVVLSLDVQRNAL